MGAICEELLDKIAREHKFEEVKQLGEGGLGYCLKVTKDRASACVSLLFVFQRRRPSLRGARLRGAICYLDVKCVACIDGHAHHACDTNYAHIACRMTPRASSRRPRSMTNRGRFCKRLYLSNRYCSLRSASRYCGDCHGLLHM